MGQNMDLYIALKKFFSKSTSCKPLKWKKENKNLDGAVLKIASRGHPDRENTQGKGRGFCFTPFRCCFLPWELNGIFLLAKVSVARFLTQVNGLAIPYLAHKWMFSCFLQFRPSWSAEQPGSRDPGAEGSVLPFTFLFWTVFLRTQRSQTRKSEGTPSQGSGPTSPLKKYYKFSKKNRKSSTFIPLNLVLWKTSNLKEEYRKSWPRGLTSAFLHLLSVPSAY